MTRVTQTDTFKINGAEELKALFKKLPEKVGNRLQRKALVKANKILIDEVIKNVPVDEGALRASIEGKIRKRGHQYIAQVMAGGEQAWYAHLVEYGFVHTGHKTTSKITGKKIQKSQKPTSRGHVPGKKYLRGSLANKAQTIIDTLTDSMKELFEKEVLKRGL